MWRIRARRPPGEGSAASVAVLVERWYRQVMQKPSRVDLLLLAVILACAAYFFGWHEFDLLNAARPK